MVSALSLKQDGREMAGKKSHEPPPKRKHVLAALMEGPDAQAVLRLSVTEEADGHWVIAATVQMNDSLPVYVLSSALDDAKRRVRSVVGDMVEIYIEPELVKDPSRQDPPTDVIVIRASD
jgi:divalent metal cation (Fe/Co/Zn/Cd) transporter